MTYYGVYIYKRLEHVNKPLCIDDSKIKIVFVIELHLNLLVNITG